MAEQKETTIVEIKFDTGKAAEQLRSVVTTISDLKKEQSALKKEIESGKDATGELTAEYALNEKTIRELTAQQKALSGQLQTTSTTSEALGDSFKELDAQCRELEYQYKSLTKAQRESAEGQELKKKLIESKQALKDFDAELGNHQRNVGNYPQALNSAIPYMDKFQAALGKIGLSMEDLGADAKSAFSAIGNGMKGLGKQAMSALANPIVLAVAAVLVVLKQLYDAIQRSEQAQLSWQKAIAPFKALWQNFQRVFDDVIKLVNTLTESFGGLRKISELYMRQFLLPYNIIIGAIRVAIANWTAAFQVLIKVFKIGQDAVKNFIQQSPLSSYFDKARSAVESAKTALNEFVSRVKEARDAIVNSKIGQFLGLEEYSENIKGIVLSNQELIDSNREVAESEAQLAAKRTQYTKEDADAQREISDLKAKAADKEKYSVGERIAMLQEAQKKEEEVAQRAYELAKQQYELEQLKNSLTESNAEDLQREASAYAAMVQAETSLNNKRKENASAISGLIQEGVSQAREAAATRLEIERALQDAILELEKDATQKSILQIQLASDREIENLREKLNKLKRSDVKGRQLLQDLILAKEKETQKRIDEITIQAASEREEKARQIAREEAEIGIRDAQKLAQMRLDNTRADYERLQNLTQEQIEVLYKTEQDYELAVLAAKRAFYEAQEAVTADAYEREKQATANAFEERKLAASENDLELAQIEIGQAAYENEQLLNMDDETKSRLFQNQEEYEAAVIASNARVTDANKKAIAAQRQMAIANASAIGGAMDALSGLLDQFGEENKEAAIASKAIALGKIAIDTGVAIAGGVAQAQSVPFPANIAAIATTIATVVANMASAISTVKSAKFNDAGNFADGGTIKGNSYTGDKLIAHVNSGEGIYTGTQANNLLREIANNPQRGGLDYERMAAATAAAVATLPAPVMAYSEFREFEQKVSTFDEIAAI